MVEGNTEPVAAVDQQKETPVSETPGVPKNETGVGGDAQNSAKGEVVEDGGVADVMAAGVEESKAAEETEKQATARKAAEDDKEAKQKAAE
ncbi:MAG: hypothetical protein OEV64_13955, partial [Desulfobulbaceae bacterium]|nr:hypothetical protein [Desulfobulbaceae bacterium]